MNKARPFDLLLEAWLDDGPTSAPADLGPAIQDQLSARRQDGRPFRTTRRILMSTSVMRAAAAAVAILAIVAGGFWLGGNHGQSPSPIGADGSPSAQATLTAEATPSASSDATTGPIPSGTPVPADISICLPSALDARIVGWDGATGHRIATVELRNAGSATCAWPVIDQVQLVDGSGSILINGPVATIDGLGMLNLAAGDVVSTLVQDGNYCRQDPIAPVTVAFVLPGGAGRVVATPVSPTDLEGVPPCSSSIGSPGDIEMHPWSR
jgi:hypothetical protein